MKKNEAIIITVVNNGYVVKPDRKDSQIGADDINIFQCIGSIDEQGTLAYFLYNHFEE